MRHNTILIKKGRTLIWINKVRGQAHPPGRNPKMEQKVGGPLGLFFVFWAQNRKFCNRLNSPKSTKVLRLNCIYNQRNAQKTSTSYRKE